MKEKIRIGIVGNPNSGKTTLFNAITGGNQRIGNWPGVTVDRKSGNYVHDGKEIEIIDLPGIYSFSGEALDEKTAQDYILNGSPDLVINVLDASNLERNLYLTLQLLEMDAPMVIALNMLDIAHQRNIQIDAKALSKQLNCPVVTTIAAKNEGLHKLKDIINETIHSKSAAHSDIQVKYPSEVEEECVFLANELFDASPTEIKKNRWRILQMLEDSMALSFSHVSQLALSNMVDQAKLRIEEKLKEEVDIVIADTRYSFIHKICDVVVRKKNANKQNFTDFLDRIVLNRFLGIPIFLMAMYSTFWVTINLGGCFIDFFDILFGAVFVDGFDQLMSHFAVPDFVRTLLAGGIGGGIQTISTFIPPIFFMFFCLAILEDSGYMARAAFVMDRLMQSVGLPGKAFIPLLVGFGCNVPAIMATRSLDNERDRILTIMMNPFMSCGARMPVYALFAAAMFPHSGGLVVFVLYLTGIILAILTALLLKKSILKGESSSFILEIPPYHIPTLKGILIHTWMRLKAFMLKAGKAILLVVVILNFLSSIGTDGSFGNQDNENSVLSYMGKSIIPIFKPTGLKEENWPAAVGIFSGIFAKEAVIGTLDTLYTQMDKEASEGGIEEKFSFFSSVGDAFASIPENLSGLSLPFSVASLIGADVDSAIGDLEVSDQTYTSLNRGFDGKVGAFAYLLIILLYMPCVAAISAVYRELNMRWTLFSAIYLSALAWIISTLFYQTMRFSSHPQISMMWISICIAILAAFFVGLKVCGEARVAH